MISVRKSGVRDLSDARVRPETRSNERHPPPLSSRSRGARRGAVGGSTSAMPFQVGGTKKGGMPVTTEKRPRGKTVTLISNVRGDKGELIQMLKQALGCGGRAVAHDTVEIQGDHADAIQGLLLRHVGVGAMRGVAGLKPPNPTPPSSPPSSTRRHVARRAPSPRRRSPPSADAASSSVSAPSARRSRRSTRTPASFTPSPP